MWTSLLRGDTMIETIYTFFQMLDMLLFFGFIWGRIMEWKSDNQIVFKGYLYRRCNNV